jgi:succinate dehydrogenase / fumarate reductase flavoprotein subunit
VPRKKGDTRAPREIPEPERYYFLEERYPKYKNLVPRDIATREIFSVCVNDGLGVRGERQVYLDLTHLPASTHHKLEGILEIYKKFMGEDPQHVPMRIFPSVHYSMGGLWTTFTKGSYNPAEPRTKHVSGSRAPIGSELGQGMLPGAPNNSMTNIPGLYAFGEVNFAFHGANRLGANALLSCIFEGLFCGMSVATYVNDIVAGKGAETVGQQAYDRVVQQEEAKVRTLVETRKAGDQASPETNPYQIGKEMGDEMTEACTVVRSEGRLKQCIAKLDSLKARWSRITLKDDASWTNQSLVYTRAIGDMLLVAEALAKGALERRESRGAHYREDYQQRDDANFMKSTVAKFDPATRSTSISFMEIDASLIKSTARTYGKTDGGGAAGAKAASPHV